MTPIPLITAAEAYPALERLVAGAEREVFLSFRVLNPATRLRAPEIRERGLETWADLIAWVARRGVAVRMVLTDFDPLFASPLHRDAWAAASGFADTAEGDVQILCAPHGQEVGGLWRMMLWTKIARKLRLLRDDPPDRLTPVQRAMLKARPILRPVSIHQKCAGIDGQRCIIGGIDVNERRWDDSAHERPGEETWHDVSMAIDGAFAGAVRTHLVETWNAALESGAADLGTGARPIDPGSRPQGTSDLRLLRTVSAPMRGPLAFGPRPRVREHEDTLLRAIGEARRYIYVETQFLRHRPLVEALEAAARRAPDLQLMILLPVEPERVLFDGDRSLNARHAHALQTRALQALTEAFGPCLSLVTPGQRRAADAGAPDSIYGAPPVYVHAKVTLIDDALGIVGSANLNGRSLRWDTEASVLFRDTDVVRGLFERLAGKWLGEEAEEAKLRSAAHWRAVAEANAERAPEERSGFALPYPLDRAKRLATYLPFLPADMF